MDGPRTVRRDELDGLLDLLADVWPHFHTRYSKQYLRSATRRPVHRRHAHVIADKGRIVSNTQVIYNHISIYGCRTRVAGIGCVCTSRDHRGRGLATSLLHHCLDDMRARAARILYVSGDRGLYRRNHCRHVGAFFQVEITADSLPPSTASISPSLVSTDQWPLLAPLHQCEPVRFLRAADFLSRTCFWWDDMRPEFWLLAANHAPLAFLALAPPWGASPDHPARLVAEYAGSRAAILDAIPALLQTAPFSRLRLTIPHWDGEMLHLLSRLGLTLSPTTLFDHTIRLLDLPGLMRDLRPYLAARLPRADLRRLSFSQQETDCLISYAGEQARLGLADTARLLFGSPKTPRLPPSLGPLLSHLLPIPLPDPGLNHI